MSDQTRRDREQPRAGGAAAATVRLAEVVAALSLATDLGMGQPLEFALRSCMLSVRLAHALALPEEQVREVFYQALLRYIGCNVDTRLLAAIVGDELAFRADFATIDGGRAAAVLALFVGAIREANAGAGALRMASALARGLLGVPAVRAAFAGHCEVAQRLAQRLGFGAGVVAALGQLYERWDGRGAPNGVRGEALLPAVRVVSVAQDALAVHALGGLESAVGAVRERSGSAYAPDVAACFSRHAARLLDGLGAGEAPEWSAVLELEPPPRLALSGDALREALRAMADFADLKSSFTLGHSPAVAALATAAAARCGLPAADQELVREAALVHELGRTGVSASIWEKEGPLSQTEWERVRLYPYFTGRILARPAALARLGAVAALQAERLDGSGYYRGLRATMLPPAARILAAADVYRALCEPRAYRPAHAPEQAAALLGREARAGRLDSDAVGAVLAAAGHAGRHAHPRSLAGLTPRELEVLRLIARGSSTKRVARILGIAPKTADHHIQHVYAKIAVTTRAGATLFALEHDLLAGEAEMG